MSRKQTTAKQYMGVAFMVALPFIAIGIMNVYESSAVTCAESPVARETERVDDPDILVGKEVTVDGKDGTETICTTSKGETKSVTPLTEPVNTVVKVGTLVPETYCIDVTSYDRNWNNDMKCFEPDGSVFYTDYDDAEQYEER